MKYKSYYLYDSNLIQPDFIDMVFDDLKNRLQVPGDFYSYAKFSIHYGFRECVHLKYNTKISYSFNNGTSIFTRYETPEQIKNRLDSVNKAKRHHFSIDMIKGELPKDTYEGFVFTDISNKYLKTTPSIQTMQRLYDAHLDDRLLMTHITDIEAEVNDSNKENFNHDFVINNCDVLFKDIMTGDHIFDFDFKIDNDEDAELDIIHFPYFRVDIKYKGMVIVYTGVDKNLPLDCEITGNFDMANIRHEDKLASKKTNLLLSFLGLGVFAISSIITFIGAFTSNDDFIYWGEQIGFGGLIFAAVLFLIAYRFFTLPKTPKFKSEIDVRYRKEFALVKKDMFIPKLYKNITPFKLLERPTSQYSLIDKQEIKQDMHEETPSCKMVKISFPKDEIISKD